ncbi:MAG: restriction endonuclease subunit S [ANME-2 cluster archaeon]|nr:MAG: restriction endonuclease subunit S [ANME-2 cluster archaeon]
MVDKQTSKWDLVKLGDIVSFKTGKLNSNAATFNGIYPFFTCSQETYRTDTYSFDTDCVLLGGNNANGIYPLKYFSGKFDAYQRTYIIRTLNERILINRYLFFALRLKLEMLKSISTGAATKFLTLTILKDIDFELPPIPTQRKIAAILSAYDDLIENNTRRIKILEEMAQALYSEWFVKFRFPGHETVKLVESELGMVPEGWEVKNLGDLADINASSVKKGNELKEISYIDIASVSTGQIDKIEPINFVDAPSRARRIVKHGDIIWSTVRPNRKSYSIILRPVSNLIVSTGFVVITAKLVPYTYLYHALTTDDFVGYLTNHASGSAYPAVNSGDFNNASVLLPPNTLLQSFNKIVSDIFENKQNMLEKNDKLRSTRDLLLPKLISGEVDVSSLDILTGELT